MSRGINIYPFEDQDNEGGHHGGVGAVVLVVHVSDVLIIVVSPGGPGSKHNNRSLQIISFLIYQFSYIFHSRHVTFANIYCCQCNIIYSCSKNTS